MLLPLLRLGFDGAVACAGGYVFCGTRVLYDSPMPDAERDEALRTFAENGVYRTIETLDECYCDEEIVDFIGRISCGDMEAVRWRRALEERFGMRPMREYDGRPVYKMVFTCENEAQLDPVRAVLGDRYRFVPQYAFGPVSFNGEFVPRRFDKGSGVRRAAEALGFALADTVGFGDSLNDLEMIETVALSVCMENGSEEIKRISDLVCPAVEADGLAQAFAQLGLG
jgi:hypothetical protein